MTCSEKIIKVVVIMSNDLPALCVSRKLID